MTDYSHDRQIRIWGDENQEKLYNTNVLILGSGLLGQMVLGCLSGLGVGNILILDNKRTSSCDRDFMFPALPYEGLKKIEKIQSVAEEMSMRGSVVGVHSRFSESLLDYLEFHPEIVIDTNNLGKEVSLKYASSHDLAYISAYCNETKSITSVFNGSVDDVVDDSEITRECFFQGGIPAGVSAGIIVDEVRKRVFTIDESDEALSGRFVYNLESSKRTSVPSDICLEKRLDNKKVLVVGAGAIGNYVAMNLALSGFGRVDIIDYDLIEGTNLARQILLYGEIGKNKSEVLLKRIKEFGKVSGRAFDYKLDSSSLDLVKKGSYDIVFGCVDNNSARFDLSEIALDLEIPYIDGGTSPLEGVVSFYIPGRTPCIKCKKGLKKDSDAKASCVQEVMPSVVTSNIIVGSLMVGEAIHVLNGQSGDFRIFYDSLNKDRIFLAAENRSSDFCSC